MRALSRREEKFVGFYLGESNGVAADAARRAGYAHGRVAGCRLLARVNVQDAIRQRVEGSGCSESLVLGRLQAIAQGPIDKCDPVRALELLGRYLGLWTTHERKLRRQALKLKAQEIASRAGTEEFKLSDCVADAEARAEALLKEREAMRLAGRETC